MALDWSKEISLSGLRKARPKARETYPTKTYMNLAVADRRTVELRRVVPVAILLVVIVAAFAKFGVYDFIDQVNVKQAELSQQRQVLSGLQAQIATADEVSDEYSLYVFSQLTGDSSTVSPLEALRLVDSTIRPAATVASLTYEGNTLTLTLANASLGNLSDLITSLYAQPNVENVSVSNATTGQTADRDVLTSMVVTLKRGEAEQ